MEFILEISYLIASITFIVGLKMLSNPESARKGNLLAAAGMGIAIVATILFHKSSHYVSVCKYVDFIVYIEELLQTIYPVERRYSKCINVTP